MPTKKVEFTKTISVKLTPDMYRLIAAMRRVYGNDADVLRAGVMALWREYNALPGAESQGDDGPPTPTPNPIARPSISKRRTFGANAEHL